MRTRTSPDSGTTQRCWAYLPLANCARGQCSSCTTDHGQRRHRFSRLVPSGLSLQALDRWAFNVRELLFKVHLGGSRLLRSCAHPGMRSVAGSAEEQGQHGQDEQVQRLVDGDHAPLHGCEPGAAGHP
jgi:hypothetical protein